MPYVNVDPVIMRTLMNRQEMNGQQVAQLAGVSPRRVQYVLSGQHSRVSVRLARSLAEVLGVPAPVLVADPVDRGTVFAVGVTNDENDDTDETDDGADASAGEPISAAAVSA